MDRLSEYNWILSILTDLKHNYCPSHNESVLIEMIAYVNNRRDSEEKTIIARSK